ncbi:hypothetical protein BS47DRAFT_1439992 [Hydnum rufescens UP504]|uniref:L-ornithine N(5)-oxygenase n=1 Tax=Hydnum rufescens UP504 TaxID=1448309 RepID=A0A9P6E0G7_9AGAM|nr:hypothetical protein BS47DRAFT_1439992 [Hydnum rufescens UP504]
MTSPPDLLLPCCPNPPRAPLRRMNSHSSCTIFSHTQYPSPSLHRIAGLLAALALKKRLGYTNFIVYEKGPEVGGTWRENTYPGCGCDIPSHWYAISSEPNTNWSRTFSSQPEILQYLKDVAVRNNLGPFLNFNCKFVSGVWDSTAQHYNIIIERTHPNGTKTADTTRAQIIISAVGILHHPKMPDIKGLETFKGDIFHPAQWRHDVSLEHKKVGVIGNGCSAAQLVPAITEDPTVDVLNFCRTPSWFLPRDQREYGEFARWLFKSVPGLLALFRALIFFQSDIKYLLWKQKFALLRKIAEMVSRQYVRSKAPKEMLAQLYPHYPLGCKRVVFDPGYLSSLHQPNLKLEWDPIVEIVKDGIVTANGTHHKLDVLIPATGYDLSPNTAPPVTGINGTTIHDYFLSQGGSTAYRGTTLPGFPNLFILLGPNVSSGHGSVIFALEVDYIMKMLKPMLAKNSKIRTIEVDSTATQKFNDQLQKRMEGTIWTACVSWYQPGTKNVAMYPGTLTSLWASMRNPKWKDYIVGKEDDKLTLGTENGRTIEP